MNFCRIYDVYNKYVAKDNAELHVGLVVSFLNVFLAH
jgi:hypothetical protein